jgi:hypothetical protein
MKINSDLGLFGKIVLTAAMLFVFTAGQSAFAQTAPQKRWSVTGMVGYQYDDNVTTDEVDSTSNLSDQALLIEFGGAYKPRLGETLGLEIGYDFSQSLYQDLTDYDLQLHTLSASIEREYGEIDAGLLYLYSRTFLGGDDFLGINNFTPSLGHAFSEKWYLSLRYSHQAKDFIQSSNDGRDADNNSFTVDNFLFFMEGKGQLSLGYRIEGENTSSDEYDYLGHFFNARLKLPVPVTALADYNAVFRMGLEYSTKDYSNVTSSIGTERQDDRTSFTVSAEADIVKNVLAKVEFERIEVVSNLPSSDLDENVVTLKLVISY